MESTVKNNIIENLVLSIIVLDLLNKMTKL